LTERLADQDKSLYAAFALSFFIGFGSGNFYAGNTPRGYLFLMLEFLTGALLAGGIAAYYADPDADTADSVISPSEGMMLGGGVLFIGSRAGDVISAVMNARDYNQRFKFKFSEQTPRKIPSVYPTLIRTNDRSMAYGLSWQF
jgi:hypothetical protein